MTKTIAEVFEKLENKMRKIYEHGYSKKEMMSVFMQYSDQAQKGIEGIVEKTISTKMIDEVIEDEGTINLQALRNLRKALLGEDKETK